MYVAMQFIYVYSSYLGYVHSCVPGVFGTLIKQNNINVYTQHKNNNSKPAANYICWLVFEM